jgi:hypothetical protein
VLYVDRYDANIELLWFCNGNQLQGSSSAETEIILRKSYIVMVADFISSRERFATPRLNDIFVLSFISRDLPKTHLPSLYSVVGS